MKVAQAVFTIVIGGFAVLFIAIGADRSDVPASIGLAVFLVAFGVRAGLIAGGHLLSRNAISALYLGSAVLLAIGAITDSWPLSLLAAYCVYCAWSSRQAFLGEPS